MPKRTRQAGAGGPAEDTIVAAELVGSTDPADRGAWLVYKASAEAYKASADAELVRLRDRVAALTAAQTLGVANLRDLARERDRLCTRNEHQTSLVAELRTDVKRRKRQTARAVQILLLE